MSCYNKTLLDKRPKHRASVLGAPQLGNALIQNCSGLGLCHGVASEIQVIVLAHLQDSSMHVLGYCLKLTQDYGAVPVLVSPGDGKETKSFMKAFWKKCTWLGLSSGDVEIVHGLDEASEYLQTILGE